MNDLSSTGDDSSPEATLPPEFMEDYDKIIDHLKFADTITNQFKKLSTQRIKD